MSRRSHRSLISLCLAFVSCRTEPPSDTTFVVANGTRGELLITTGCPSHKDAIIEFDAARRTYIALSPGTTTIACGATSVAIEVKPIARIAIEGPAEPPNNRYSAYHVVGFGVDNASIALGTSSDVVWTFSDDVERLPVCTTDRSACSARAVAKIKGSPGKHTLSARFLDMTATRDITFVDVLR
jgi:hypothetical protein